MIIRHSPPICDECSNEVTESFHAILGGKAYRLCGEACRSSCRARYLELRPHAASASGETSTGHDGGSVTFLRAAYGDEWG